MSGRESLLLTGLNDRQIEAVISEERRLLVLAGAGSGKTKTLLQKIGYLIEQKGVSPAAILAITFTKNATNEMIDRLIVAADSTGVYSQILADKYRSKAEKDQERLNYQKKFRWIDALTVRTFHGFCYGVLRNHGANEFDNRFRIIGDEKRNEEDDLSRIVAPETVYEVFHKLVIEACEETDFLLRLKRHILDYFVDKIHRTGAESAFNRDGKYFTTLDGTRVRSKSEQFIADWLYRHSIKYVYEPLLNVRDFSFHPDFFIPEANVYIEHVSEKSYSTREKEEQFRKGSLLLVKTFESMTRDSALFNHTLDKIIRNRLPSNYHVNTVLNYKEEFNGYHEDIKKFITQIIRITDMIKVENIPLEKVLEKAASDPHERVRDFYALALPLVKKYTQYCTNKSYLDFNDLISRTISLFTKNEDIGNKYKSKFRYILVDEFQDVNNLQVELVKLMLDDDTQLFCVGDDWQSIYGFRGSNVSYIIDFENHFPEARVVKLNLNYRSTQQIVGASNEVIKRNKFKVEKEIVARHKSEHKIVVFSGNSIEENVQFAVEEVGRFLRDGISGEDILFLYRRSKMFSNFFDQNKSYYHQLRNAGYKVQAKTIHAAKGLEAKIVFIIGLSEGDGGFPDIWLEDRIFQIIKKANHDLLLEEERRLFYVAMTRAKEKLFLITEKGNESGFIREIPAIYTVRTAAPLKSMVDPIPVCERCFSELNKLWIICPFCGEKIKPLEGV